MKLIESPPGCKPLYAALGVREKASPEEIRDAYRRIAKHYHHDLAGESQYWLDAMHAYEILSDPAKRKTYDKTGIDPSMNGIERRAMEAVSETTFRILTNSHAPVWDLVKSVREAITQELAAAVEELRKIDKSVTMLNEQSARLRRHWNGAEAVRENVLAKLARAAEEIEQKRPAQTDRKQMFTLALRLLDGANWWVDSPGVEQQPALSNSVSANQAGGFYFVQYPWTTGS